MVDDLLNKNININLSELSGVPDNSESEPSEQVNFKREKADFKKLI